MSDAERIASLEADVASLRTTLDKLLVLTACTNGNFNSRTSAKRAYERLVPEIMVAETRVIRAETGDRPSQVAQVAP